MSKPKDKKPVEQPPPLTTADEAILDKVWAKVTPEQLAQSKAFLARVAATKAKEKEQGK